MKSFVFQEKPKLKRRLSSRKSSLRNSIRRHNSKQRKSREDSIIVNDSDVLEGGGLLSPSPHPDTVNTGAILNFMEARYGLLTLSLPRVPSSKLRGKFWISFCKIVKNKQYHMKVLLNSFHLNGHTKISSTDSKVTTIFIDSRFYSGSERDKLYMYINNWRVKSKTTVYATCKWAKRVLPT